MSFESVFSRFLLFLMLMDPFGNLPVFVVILKWNSAQEYRRIIFRESVFALATMLVAMFAGGMILKLLHLSEDKLGIAGGLLLFIIGLKMVFSSFSESGIAETKEPYIVPLAIPLVAGPGALSMIMIISAQQSSRLTTLGVVLVASIINSAILMCSSFISNVLGKRGLLAIERLTGMILILTSVNMVMGGIAEFIKL